MTLKRPDEARVRLLLRESLILDVTEEICRLLATRGVRRSELAKTLGIPRSSVVRLLDGDAQTPISRIADVFWALGAKLEVHAVPIDKQEAP